MTSVLPPRPPKSISASPATSAANRVQRPHLREVAEGAGRPVAEVAPGDEAVHDGHQLAGAVRTELHNPQVLAVRDISRTRPHRTCTFISSSPNGG